MWLTETGGIVKFGGVFPEQERLRPLARVEGRSSYMFNVAASNTRIKRLYIYNWIGRQRHDALRRRADERPRPAARRATSWSAKQLHAAKCSVKTARN